MKTALLFTFVFFYLVSFGQGKIEVDFGKASYKKTVIDPLKKGDLYYFEIKNINQNNYNIEIKVKDSIVSKPIDFDTFTDFGTSGLIDMIGAVSLVSKQVFSSISDQESANNFLEKKKNEPPKKDLEIIKKEKDIVIAELKKLLDLQKEMNAINWNFDSGIDAIQNKLNRSRLNDTNSLKKTENQLTDADLQQFENHIQRTKTQIFNIKSKLYSNQTTLNIYTIGNSDQIRKAKLDTVYKTILVDYSNLITACDQAFENLCSKKIDTMSLQLIECINLSNHTYTSFPFRYNGEIAEIELKFTPYPSQPKLKTIIVPIEINTMRYYIGVGPGFYTSWLHDKVYSTQTLYDPTQDTTTYKIVEEKNSNMEVGLSVLLRGGSKCKKNELFGYHGSLGVGFSFTNPSKPRIMYGIGGTYGDRHRVAVDIGLATGYTNVLSRAYSLDSQYSEAPESVVVSKMNTNIFFSVGYIFVF